MNWLGIRKTRIHLNPLTLFASALEQRIVFPPSKRVMAAYKEYVQHYIAIGDHKYVGIVFQTHHVMYFSPLKGSFEVLLTRANIYCNAVKISATFWTKLDENGRYLWLMIWGYLAVKNIV